MKTVYYKPSGKFSPSFFFYFLLFQVLSIPLLSVVYIYLIYYIPIIYFNFLITVGCGIAAGLVMTGILHIGKVRNNAIALVFGIIAVCIMKYVQWCIYIPIVYSNAYEIYALTMADRFAMSFDLLIHPAAVFESIGFINQVGVWSVFTIGFNGVLLIIVWLLEFLLMAATACFVSLEKTASPFYEKEEAWYIELPDKIKASFPEDFERVKNDMETGNFSELLRLTKEYKPDDTPYLSLQFYKPKHSEHYYFKIKKITVTQEKGKTKTSEEVLIKYLSIDSNSAGELQAAINQPE